MGKNKKEHRKKIAARNKKLSDNKIRLERDIQKRLEEIKIQMDKTKNEEEITPVEVIEESENKE